MSKISLTPNASGTGNFTIASPNSSTDRTLTLPDSTGTVVVTSGAQTIEFADGSASAPSITNSGDTNTGIFFPAADTIAFAEGGAESMRIDSSGNLLINSTSRASAERVNITVDGNAQENIILVNTNTSAGNNTAIGFRRAAGTTVGTITTTTSSTAYNTGSDYRLKENIIPMTGALNKVIQLNPVNWTWKVDGSDGQGFIAHELAEVIPDAVSGEKDAVDEEGNPKYQGVDTSFLVATLTAAIQEQQTIIETLKADIAELKAKVNV